MKMSFSYAIIPNMLYDFKNFLKSHTFWEAN